MHANAEQLLAYQGEELLDVTVRDHVARCGECQQRLAELQAVKTELRALPEQKPAGDFWPDVLAAVETPANRSFGDPWFRYAALGVTASLIFAVALVVLQFGPTPGTPVIDAASQGELEQLVSQSQKLESYLSQVQYGGAVTSARTAGTIVELEDGIAYIDYQLNNAKQLGLGRSQQIRLWEMRNELMQTLVTVHYAQARANSI